MLFVEFIARLNENDVKQLIIRVFPVVVKLSDDGGCCLHGGATSWRSWIGRDGMSGNGSCFRNNRIRLFV